MKIVFKRRVELVSNRLLHEMSGASLEEMLSGVMSGSEDDVSLSREQSAAVIRLSTEPEGAGQGVWSEALLRSRVEQQSTLIAMLKQRADETFAELKLYKQHYEDTLTKRQELELTLQEESRQRVLVEQRFATLAGNHEEMIKIKDEYKGSNQDLRSENERLRRDNEMMFSAALEERDLQLSQLREELAASGEQRKAAEERCSALESRVKEVERTLQKERERLAGEVARLKGELTGSQQVHGDLRASLERREDEIRALRKEKQQLEGLHSNLKQEIQSKESLVAELQSKYSRAEQDSEKLRGDFKQRAEEVSKDTQVLKLRRELQMAQEKTHSLEREFSAYKKHSSELLRQERELNSKLRHMVE